MLVASERLRCKDPSLPPSAHRPLLAYRLPRASIRLPPCTLTNSHATPSLRTHPVTRRCRFSLRVHRRRCRFSLRSCRHCPTALSSRVAAGPAPFARCHLGCSLSVSPLPWLLLPCLLPSGCSVPPRVCRCQQGWSLLTGPSALPA